MKIYWLYLILLILLVIVGLTIGSVNSSMVTFDFLLFKVELSLAMILVVGIAVGIVIGLYISLIYSIRVWRKNVALKSELAKIRKENKTIKENSVTTTND